MSQMFFLVCFCLFGFLFCSFLFLFESLVSFSLSVDWWVGRSVGRLFCLFVFCFLLLSMLCMYEGVVF